MVLNGGSTGYDEQALLKKTRDSILTYYTIRRVIAGRGGPFFEAAAQSASVNLVPLLLTHRRSTPSARGRTDN